MTETSFGELREITLTPGTIRYRDVGSGPTIVFVHGALVNGLLWRKVVPSLARDFRCIVPDLPLGSHAVPMRPDADLSPPAVADAIHEFLAALDLNDVTLVGNDTGGALCQLLVTRHPERVGRLVLTNCDALEVFPPSIFAGLVSMARIPALLGLVLKGTRIRALARSPLVFGWLAKHGLDDATLDAYLRPVRETPGILHDLAKVARGLDPRLTLEAAERLRGFTRPTLLAWAHEDRLFPVTLAERLASLLPDARVVRIADSLTFVSEDQPARLAELIASFVATPHALSA
jgi:pimeloyl-ACP methyl ester carboxylesterase